MLRLVPCDATDSAPRDAQEAFDMRYDSLYEMAPDYVAQLMVITPYGPDDPRSRANRPLPLFRAPATRRLSDTEQAAALLRDTERHEEAITQAIRATSGANDADGETEGDTPLPLLTYIPRAFTLLAPAAGGADCFISRW